MEAVGNNTKYAVVDSRQEVVLWIVVLGGLTPAHRYEVLQVPRT